jgi:hypothetical protein
MSKIWVIVENWNDYNQHGSYFIAAWIERPTAQDLMKSLRITESEASRVLAGGGRKGAEGTWYTLFETGPGEACTTE